VGVEGGEEGKEEGGKVGGKGGQRDGGRGEVYGEHNVMTSFYITGICSPLLDGIQPHLGMSTLHSPTSPSYMAPPPNHSYNSPRSCVLDKDFIQNVDLPGLSAEDIEAVLSENEDWSGEQIDQFLRSAVDLSEIESKLFSLAGYESDSGYSTYDVSPITSAAPSNLNYSMNQVPPSCPPPLTLSNHATSPLLGNPAFPGMPLPNHPAPSPLMHEAAISPCGSDPGFFSPHSNFGSLANTPNQDAIVFFPPPGPIYSQPYTQPQDFHNNNMFSSCFHDSASVIPNFSLQIPDIILHDVNAPPPSHLPPLMPAGDIKFSSCSHKQERPSRKESSLEESDIDVLVKEEGSSTTACVFEQGSPVHSESGVLPSPPALLSAPPALTSDCKMEMPAVSTHCVHDPEGSGAHATTAAARYRYSALLGSNSKKDKTSKATAKVVQKKKKKSTQWPRSMNRANLMAFREHILNKLKKAQEVTPLDLPTTSAQRQILSNQADVNSKCPGDSSAPPVKFEAPSPNSPFELQVTYERNHLSLPKRCHSEPARLQNMAAMIGSASTLLQTSQSDGKLNVSSQYLNELKLSGDCGELFSEFNYNPDTLLSPTVEEKFLSDLELKFNTEVDEDGAEMFCLFSESSRPLHSSSSLSEVETMDMDCIQDFLDDSKQQVFSPSPSTIAASPSGSLCIPEGDNHTLCGSTSSPVSLIRSESTASVDKSTPNFSACHSPGDSQEDDNADSTFNFPEILSIHGSMVLDGVNVLSDEEASPGGQPQHALLRAHHDPLLATDSVGTWN
jgi:hypothetical protein